MKRFPIDVMKDPEFFMQIFYTTTSCNGLLTVKALGHFMLYMKSLAIFGDENNPVHKELF